MKFTTELILVNLQYFLMVVLMVGISTVKKEVMVMNLYSENQVICTEQEQDVNHMQTQQVGVRSDKLL
jgi:hypothetical protein